jgi:hypothetical protein
MNCDEVFVILTRGPFPSGSPHDRRVEAHLQRCADCQRLAEALRPNDDTLRESIGLDEGVVFNRTALYNFSTGLKADGTAGDAYGGQVAPDIVGNIRVDQAWGLIQLSAAAHEVNGSYNTLAGSAVAPTSASELSGQPESKWGGSVMVGLNINNIPTGAGDDI